MHMKYKLDAIVQYTHTHTHTRTHTHVNAYCLEMDRGAMWSNNKNNNSRSFMYECFSARSFSTSSQFFGELIAASSIIRCGCVLTHRCVLELLIRELKLPRRDGSLRRRW